MPSAEEKRRVVRELVNRSGRGFAESCGFRVTNNPANLFQLLYLSIVLSGTDDYQQAAVTARAMRDRGWDTPRTMASSLHRDRVAVLRESGQQDSVEQLASTFGDLGQVALDRYRGDLRRLRSEAQGDPTRVRSLLHELPGVDDAAVDIFFRDVQALWPEVGPFADRHALSAAERLGLGRSTRELAEFARGGGTEKLSWLVGALARVQLDNSYDDWGKDVGSETE